MTGIEITAGTVYLIALWVIWFLFNRANNKLMAKNTDLMVSNHDMARRLSILIELTDGIEELVQDNPGRTPDMPRIIEELRSITK